MPKCKFVVIGKARVGYVQGLTITQGGWLVPVDGKPATLFADEKAAQAAIETTKANQTADNRHIAEFYVVPAEE